MGANPVVSSVAVEVVPDARGFFRQLQSDLMADVQQMSREASAAVSDTVNSAVTESVQQAVGPAKAAARQVAEAATDTVATTMVSKRAMVVGTLKEIFTQPIQAARDFRTGVATAIDEVGGKSAALKLLGSRALEAGRGLKTLATRGLSLRAVTNAAQGMGGALGGVASVLGAGGPWGIALAGAGVGLAAFQQAQENARQAVDILTNSLNQQTGAFTAKSFQQIADNLRENITSVEEWNRLATLGFPMERILVAFGKGGEAVAGLRKEIQDAAKKSVGYRGLLYSLDSTIGNLTEETYDSGQQFLLQKAATDAVSGAMKELGIQTDAATSSAQGMTAAVVSNASVQQMMAEWTHKTGEGLDGISDAQDRVTKAIERAPKKVIITAQGVGFEALQAQIKAAATALYLLAQARYHQAAAVKSAQQGLGMDPGRPGGDAASSYFGGVDSSDSALAEAQRRYDAAVAAAKKARDAINSHNDSARAAVSGAVSGGSGSAVDQAVKAAAQARKELRKATRGVLIKDLLTATPDQINSALRDTIANIKAAFSGKREKDLLKLVRADNTALQAAAAQRAAIGDKLDTLTQSAASVRESAIGSITERSWTGKGVQELLRRRLAHIVSLKNDLKVLAKRGLPQEFINDLINAGPEAAWKTAHSLATSDAATFAGIKSQAQQVIAESTKLGNLGAGLLYGAGADTAEGLIEGFRSKQKELADAMRAMAKEMQDAIKKALRIKSPSQVFDELGQQIPAGLANGITRRTPKATSAVRSMVAIPSVTPVGIGAGRGPLIGNINVDARGAHDPAAVRQAARDALYEAARDLQAVGGI